MSYRGALIWNREAIRMEGSLVNVTVGEQFLHLTGRGFTHDLRLNIQMVVCKSYKVYYNWVVTTSFHGLGFGVQSASTPKFKVNFYNWPLYIYVIKFQNFLSTL